MGRDEGWGSLLGKILVGVGALATGAYVTHKIMPEKKQIEDTRVMLPEEKHIYKPSEFNDLLDFNENPLGFPHVLWLRVLPSIVVLVSASGLIEIRENKKGIAIHSK